MPGRATQVPGARGGGTETQEQGRNKQAKTFPTPSVTLASCSTSLSLSLLFFKLKYSSLQDWGEDYVRFYMCVRVQSSQYVINDIR